MADAPPYLHPHADAPDPSPHPPAAVMRPSTGRITADGPRRTARILHIVGNVLLAVAAVAVVTVAGCMLYLSRGVYDPADVLVLLTQCLAVAVCPTAAIAAIVAHVAGFAVTSMTGRRATPASGDVPASAPTPVLDRTDSAR